MSQTHDLGKASEAVFLGCFQRESSPSLYNEINKVAYFPKLRELCLFCTPLVFL